MPVTYYCDFSSLTNGHAGTTGDPFSYNDFLTNVANDNGDTYNCKGEVTDNGIGFALSTNILKSWDMTLYGPWRIKFTNSVASVFFSVDFGMSEGILYFSGGVGIIDGGGIGFGITTNMWIIAPSGFNYYGIEFVGCTIYGNHIAITDLIDLHFTDCCLSSTLVTGGFDVTTIIYTNCSISSAINPACTKSNCQENHSFPASPAWNALRAAFDYPTLTSGVTTPPQPGNGSPSYSGYNKFLFGDARTGIGTGSVAGVSTFTVTYNGNNATHGTVPVDSNNYNTSDHVIVLGNPGYLRLDGYAFSGWNTQADGLGTNYHEGEQFTMGSNNVTLYAKWTLSGGGTMSTNALNQVYKTAILAVEEALLTGNVSAAATTIPISGKYMTATPFVVGQSYILRDDSFAAGVNGLPNQERVMVTSIAGLTATPLTDGSGGFTVAGNLTVEGYTTAGYNGGILGSYATTENASVLTPGVEMAIQSGDFNCRFKTLADAPKIDFDDESSRFATGDEGRDLSTAGARSGEISFTEKLSWGGTVTTQPKWTKLMRVMGHLIRKYAGVGFEFFPLTHANEVTATIWIIAPENGAAPSQTVYRYRGAHGGNASSISVGKIGDPWMLTGKFGAAYVGTLELSVANTRNLTSPDTVIPEVMLSNTISVPAAYGIPVTPSTYASVAAMVTALTLSTGAKIYSVDGSDVTAGSMATAKGSAVKLGDSFIIASSSTLTYTAPVKSVEISQFALDFGGVVNPFLDQATTTGNAYYATQDRDPRFTCNPYHVKKSADDIDYSVTNMMAGPIVVKSPSSTPHITVTIPNAQQLSPAMASREGYVNTNRTYRPMRNDLGAGALDSNIPNQAMYSILIGARS